MGNRPQSARELSPADRALRVLLRLPAFPDLFLSRSPVRFRRDVDRRVEASVYRGGVHRVRADDSAGDYLDHRLDPADGREEVEPPAQAGLHYGARGGVALLL